MSRIRVLPCAFVLVGVVCISSFHATAFPPAAPFYWNRLSVATGAWTSAWAAFDPFAFGQTTGTEGERRLINDSFEQVATAHAINGPDEQNYAEGLVQAQVGFNPPMQPLSNVEAGTGHIHGFSATYPAAGWVETDVEIRADSEEVIESPTYPVGTGVCAGATLELVAGTLTPYGLFSLCEDMILMVANEELHAFMSPDEAVWFSTSLTSEQFSVSPWGGVGNGTAWAEIHVQAQVGSTGRIELWHPWTTGQCGSVGTDGTMPGHTDNFENHFGCVDGVTSQGATADWSMFGSIQVADTPSETCVEYVTFSGEWLPP